MSTPVTNFGPRSQPMTCPYCHQQIRTAIETESGTKTHIFALVLCLIGCIPCCIIPYCLAVCKYKNHYCPNCGAFLGSHND